MSRQVTIVEVAPPLYEELKETMHFGNFECPKCKGRGGFTDQVGHNEYKTKCCDYCEGAGRVRAEVVVNWKPDFN